MINPTGSYTCWVYDCNAISKMVTFSYTDSESTVSPPDDCDVYDTYNSCSLFYFIPRGIIGLIIFFIGITGNIFSVLIITKMERRSVSTFLLKSLAVVDSLVLVMFSFQFSMTSILDHVYDVNITTSKYLYFRLYVGFPVFLVCLCCSGWITCLLAVHRYPVWIFIQLFSRFPCIGLHCFLFLIFGGHKSFLWAHWHWRI